MANRCGDEGVSDSDSECYVKVFSQSNDNVSSYCVRTFLYVGWKNEDRERLRLPATLALRSDYKVCFNGSPWHGFWAEQAHCNLQIVFRCQGDVQTCEACYFQRVHAADSPVGVYVMVGSCYGAMAI